MVRKFVMRLVGNETLADDLTQEAFLRAQRSTSTYRGKSSERSWLCAIAMNLVRDHFRSAAHAPTITPDPELLERLPAGEDTERAVLTAEMAQCIGEHLAQIPHPQYDVLALHDMAGLTHPEIAAVLAISTANSRVILHRGRAQLRKILERDCVLSFDDDLPCDRRPPPPSKTGD